MHSNQKMGFDYVTVVMFGITVDSLDDEIHAAIIAAGFEIGKPKHGPIIVGKVLNQDHYHRPLEYSPRDFNAIHTKLKDIGISGSSRVHVYCEAY